MADPSASTGGRDLFYLFNTYADKLRFVVDIDFRTSPDYLFLGVKVVDRMGSPQNFHHHPVRVMFALDTSQNIFSDSVLDQGTGLSTVYATSRLDGWYYVSTHPTQPTGMVYPTTLVGFDDNTLKFQTEHDVGVAFAVETSDPDGSWDSDPSRQSPFFGIHVGKYAQGFDSFAPYAVVDLVELDVCNFFPGLRNNGTSSDYIQENMDDDSRTSIESSTLTVSVPSATATLTPYYESAINFVVIGIDPTSVNQTNLQGQTWLTLPVACLVGYNKSSVTVYSYEMIDGTSTGLFTVLVRTPGGVADAAMVGEYISNNTVILSSAVSEGLRQQTMNQKSYHGTHFLPGVDVLALNVENHQVWERTVLIPGGSFATRPYPPNQVSSTVWVLLIVCTGFLYGLF